MTGTPTRITSLGVVPCYQHGGHGTVIGTALEEFCLTVNESGLLFSWYLREAGGVPARHQELTIVARDDPAEVVNSSEFSPMDWDFEQMDALVDFFDQLPRRQSARIGGTELVAHRGPRPGAAVGLVHRAVGQGVPGGDSGQHHAAASWRRSARCPACAAGGVDQIEHWTTRHRRLDSQHPGVSDPSGTILPTPRRDDSALYIRSLLML